MPTYINPEDYMRIGAAFTEAQKSIPFTGPVFLNFQTSGIAMPQTAFDKIKDALDLPRLESWIGAKDSTHGNCLFATTHAAVMLLGRGPGISFRIVTGHFKKENIDHAWIEIEVGGQAYVLNVSNLAQRPGYIIERDFFCAMHGVEQIHQKISSTVISARARVAGVTPKRHWADGGKIHRFTRKLLKPTFRLLEQSLEEVEAT